VTADQAYRVLGLSPGCSEGDLARRFRHLAQEAHPDVGGSTHQFSELSHAYAVAVEDHVRREAGGPVTTHTTSVGGRLRRLRRRAHRSLHHLTTALDHLHPSGGHP
jgi:hypothetical protein